MTARSSETPLFAARSGFGPLLQRDYWAVIEGCDARPSDIADEIARAFWTFPPRDVVVFRRVDGTDAPLRAGDELTVRIRMAGEFGVRVVHRDSNSITIATLGGHPEAGRITFGAYRNRRGDVVMHIRSRARSGSRFHRVGFLGLGDPMQLYCWTDFINQVANRFGRGVVGYVHVDTGVMDDEPLDHGERPTFVATGD